MQTDIYTYFTKADGVTQLLYSAQRWTRIELALETAGPVSIGTRETVMPVLSGQGIILRPTSDWTDFVLPKGDRLFIAAETVNRVKVIVEPIPWQEQILLQLERGFGGLKGLVGGALRRATQPTQPQPPSPPPWKKGCK